MLSSFEDLQPPRMRAASVKHKELRASIPIKVYCRQLEMVTFQHTEGHPRAAGSPVAQLDLPGWADIVPYSEGFDAIPYGP